MVDYEKEKGNINAWTCTYAYTDKITHKHIITYAHEREHMRKHKHIHILMHIHEREFSYIYIHTHAHTPTHTCSPATRSGGTADFDCESDRQRTARTVSAMAPAQVISCVGIAKVRCSDGAPEVFALRQAERLVSRCRYAKKNKKTSSLIQNKMEKLCLISYPVNETPRNVQHIARTDGIVKRQFVVCDVFGPDWC